VRLLRIPLILLLIGWGLVTLYFVALVRERYGRRGPIPVGQARMLLHPVRGLMMPARQTLARMGLQAGQTVLELGPGPGYFTIAASRLVGHTGRIICADLQPGMLQILQERLDEGGVANAHPIVADASRLPLGSGTIDLAFLVAVLGEIPDRPAALRELRRVLKPGGVLAFTETLTDPDYVLQDSLRDVCRALGFEEAGCDAVFLGYTMRFQSPKEAVLASAGT
jgi:SAM-dependent methyltransferase